MVPIKKLESRMNTLKDQETSSIINNLIDKINELTQEINTLNFVIERLPINYIKEDL